MPKFLRDVRYALRSFVRQPGVTLVILLTLAVGIGANTGIFALLSEIYWWRFPAPEPDRLFYIMTGTPDRPFGGSSQPDAAAYREALADLGDVAAWSGFGSVVGLPGEGQAKGRAVYCVGRAVSHEYFDFFGVRFAHGRGIRPEDDRPGAAPVVVLDHTFWSRHLSADPSIVGRTLHVNSVPYTVVGILPWGFQNEGITVPIYIPLPRIDDVWPRPAFSDRTLRRFASMLRLDEGATRAAAAVRLETVARNLDAEYPWASGDQRQVSLLGVEERGDDGPDADAGAAMMTAAVGLLLLLACANVANLLLVRAAGRQREIAVMAAIGASGRRIAARLMLESLILSIVGGLLGLAVARPLTDLIKSLLEVQVVGLGSLGEATQWMRYDERVLLFTFGLSVLTGCLFGLAPILFAARTDLVSALKGTALEAKPGRRFGARQALVLLQVVLSTVLLLGAGLLVRSLLGLQQRDLGFETDHQLMATMATAPPRLESPAARHEVQRQLYERARQRMAEIPGVRTATLISEPLASGYSRSTRLVLAEHGDEPLVVDNVTVGRDFFTTMSMALTKGRSFDERDRPGGMGAAIVNQAFVERFWRDEEPLGRELRLPDLGTDTADDRFVVVGIVADVRHASRRDLPTPLVYLPLAQHIWGSRMTVVARTVSRPQQLMGQAYEALAFVDPDLALAEIATYDSLMAFDLRGARLFGTVAGLLSLFGLGVASLGIYSVMSCSVSYRVRELGIRMALGASTRDVVRLVLGEAGRLVAAGVLLGVAAALALARLLSSLLHGIAVNDPWTFLPLPLLLAAVGLTAAWLPAWRAGRLDPKVALLEE